MGNRLLALGLLLVLAVANGLIIRSERVIVRGDTVYLRLVPVDPRSLMQGDYMALNFEVSGAANRQGGRSRTESGHIVVRLDAQQVGHFARFHTVGAELGPRERLLRYRRGPGGIEVGTNAWFFEEGQGHRYQGAAYGEFRVSPTGDTMLVGLADADLNAMGGQHPRWWQDLVQSAPDSD